MSLTELKATTMSFGKAHMGKSFQEIWDSDPQWIKWFLSHYAASTKTEHRKMILFIQLMIEESEKETPQPSAKALPKALAARPKSHAAPAMQMPVPTESEVESFEMMSEAPWIEASEDRGFRDSGGHSCPSDSPAQPGKCDAAHDRADVARTNDKSCHDPRRSSGNCNHRMGRSLEQLSNDNDLNCHWALKAGEIDSFCESSPNKERQHFWGLVRKMEKELSQTAAIIKPKPAASIDLLEVFCSDHNKLTSQVSQLGGQAKWFGLNQGDLMTSKGRRELFVLVIRHRPPHIWVSPVCGPWSSWSNFNSQRSLEAWDHVNNERWMMLTQIALCLVLCRYQHRCQRHAHWEQPKRSHMMKLPYVQEIQRYMMAAKPDLCQAGDLRDPTTNQFIQKGLEILTSSQKMYETLDPLKYPKNHEYQTIEGSTQVHGQKMLRSKFTETYPRKFARLVTKEMMKHRFPLERPVGSLADPMLCVLDSLPTEILAATAQERPSKCSRRAPSKGVKHDAETDTLEQPQSGKRVKLSTSIHDEENEQAEHHSQPRATIQEITNRIEAILPRVGKKTDR